METPVSMETFHPEPEIYTPKTLSETDRGAARVIEVDDNGEVEEYDLSQLKKDQNNAKFLDFEPGQKVNAGKIYGDPEDPTSHFRWEVLETQADANGAVTMIKIGSPKREDGTRLDVETVNPKLLAQLQPRFVDGDDVKGPNGNIWTVRSQGRNGRVVISSPAKPSVGRIIDAAELFLMQNQG